MNDTSWSPTHVTWTLFAAFLIWTLLRIVKTQENLIPSTKKWILPYLSLAIGLAGGAVAGAATGIGVLAGMIQGANAGIGAVVGHELVVEKLLEGREPFAREPAE